MLTKRLTVLLLILVLVLSGCTNQTEIEEINEAHKKELETLSDQLSSLAGELESKETEIMSIVETLSTLEEEVKSSESTIAEQETNIDDLQNQVKQLETDNENLLSELETYASMTPSVVDLAEDIMGFLKVEDFASVAAHVHPIQGVRFTPYPFIDLANDIVFTSAEMASFGTSVVSYNWGNYDGSGDPIVGIPMTYYDEFIYDHDYVIPDMMSWNSPIGSGNMINNMTSIYPTADYVEFHFTGFNPSYSGMDWSSLTLVFDQVGSTWYLVGIVHGQWTT